MKIRAAIAGATGYTGGELLRILLNHPDVDVVAATTTSSEGTLVAEVHRDLLGETGLKFGTDLNDPDVLFLCLGHGLSRQPGQRFPPGRGLRRTLFCIRSL